VLSLCLAEESEQQSSNNFLKKQEILPFTQVVNGKEMSGTDLAYLLGNDATKKERSVEQNKLHCWHYEKISWRLKTEFSFFMTQDSRQGKQHGTISLHFVKKKWKAYKRNNKDKIWYKPENIWQKMW